MIDEELRNVCFLSHSSPFVAWRIKFPRLIEGIDGLDMWNSLTEGAPGERDEILLNIDDRSNVSSLRVAQYKLIKGEYR